MPFSKFFQRKLAAFDRQASRFSERDLYQTNVIGLARSLLAMGTLITLAFSPYNSVFINGVGRTSGGSPDVLNELNLFLLIRSHEAARLLACGILVSVILGYFPRITGVLHWWVALSFFNGGYLVDGGDQITSVLTFLLVPITLCDPRINHWRKARQPTSPYVNLFTTIPLFLISLQMSVLYFQASQAKMNVAEWVNGTAVYYYLNNNLYGPVPIVKHFVLWLLSNKFMAVLSTWTIMIGETLFFAAIFMGRTAKRRLFYCALTFHFTVIFLHGLVSFFFAMAGGLVMYMLPYNENISLYEKNISGIFKLSSFAMLRAKRFKTGDDPVYHRNEPVG